MGALSPLESLLVAHGGALVLPLAVIEGPIVSVVAGLLSARGGLDWYWALGLLVCGDLVGDATYYWIGRTGRVPFAGLGRRFGTPAALSPDLLDGLRRDVPKMLVIGKWTHSIGALVLISAGVVRVNPLKFMLVNLVATVPKSGLLFAAGYFAWGGYPLLASHPLAVPLALLVLGGASIFWVLRRSGLIRVGRVGH